MLHDAAIHVQDNTPIHKAHDATYLGKSLNSRVNLAREVTQRIQDAKWTWTKLNLFLKLFERWKEMAVHCLGCYNQK